MNPILSAGILIGVSAFVAAQTASPSELIDLIGTHPVSWEMLPDEALGRPEVWRALIEKGTPVVGILTGWRMYDKMLANVEEVRARGADTILIAPQGDERARSLANELFEVPTTKPLLTPILDTIPLQLLAYFVAKERGLSPDKPRNLAKSVTVE